MNEIQKDNTKRLAKNTILMYCRTFVTLLLALYTSRVLIDALGVDDYGLYNVVGSVVVLFSFLNGALTMASQRFITYALGRNDEEELRDVFSASIISQFAIMILVVLLIEVLGVWFLNTTLNVPEGRMTAANILLQLSILTVAISMLRIPYEAMVIAHEKLDYFAICCIIDAALKLGIVFLLPLFCIDTLVLYGILLTIETLVMFLSYYIFCKRRFKVCSVREPKDRTIYKKILKFFGWSILGSGANVATQKGLVFILNIYYGVVVNAALGIANQVGSAVNTFIQSFQTSFKPQIIKVCAANDMSYLNTLIVMTSKFSFALVALPAMFLITNIDLVLKIWLTEVPEYTAIFCQLILVSMVIDAISGTFNIAVMANEDVKKYQIAISISFLIDLLCAYLIVSTGVKPHYVFISRIVTRGIVNMIIGLHFTKKLYDFDLKGYCRKVVLRILLTLVILIPVALVPVRFADGWQLLAISTLSIVFIGVPSVLYVLIESTERTYLFNLVKNVIKR